jgi:hypothetical protein
VFWLVLLLALLRRPVDAGMGTSAFGFVSLIAAITNAFHPESAGRTDAGGAMSKSEYVNGGIAATNACRGDLRSLRKHGDRIVKPKFQIGDRVRKARGSSWQGAICGKYSTALTPEGYAVESERERGSVHIYPASLLEAVPENVKDAPR